MIKTVIFDLGGVYFTDGTKIAIEKMSKKYKLEPKSISQVVGSDTELGKSYRKGELTAKEFWTKVKSKLGIKDDYRNLSMMWAECYKPIKGTVKIVKQLKKRGFRLYYLSDNVKERVNDLERKYKFTKNFVDGVFSYKVHKAKFDGFDIFKLALEKTGEIPENVVYIEDKEEHVKTAKRLRMNAIHFKSPEQLSKELSIILKD